MSSPFYISLYVLCPVVLLAVAALIAFAVSFGVYFDRNKKLNANLDDVTVRFDDVTAARLADARSSRASNSKTPPELVTLEDDLSDSFFSAVYGRTNRLAVGNPNLLELRRGAQTNVAELVISGRRAFRNYYKGQTGVPDYILDERDRVDNERLKAAADGTLSNDDARDNVVQLLTFYENIGRISGRESVRMARAKSGGSDGFSFLDEGTQTSR